MKLVASLLVALSFAGCREGFTDDTVDTTSAGGSTSAETSVGGGDGGTATGGVGTGGAVPNEEVRLMAWNIENLPKSADTLAKVEAIIAASSPDIVGVEEIKDLAAWDALDASLDDYESRLASDGDGYVRVGMLYRTSRVTVEDVRTELLDDSYAFPRPMLVAHVALKSNPENDFTFGVVHLKAQLDPESQARRRDACIKLDEWIILEQESETEVVIAGDFNDNLTDAEPYNVFGPLLAPSDGGFLTLPLEQANQYTYIPFTSFIDHVHVRGSIFAESTASVLTPDESDPDYVDGVSDHRPILATLRWAN